MCIRDRYYPLLKDVIVVDEANNHYIHVFMGWENGHFFHRTLIHIQVRSDRKVHVLTNNTDTLIEEDLEAAGLLKTEIICGRNIPVKEAKQVLGLAA